MENAATTLTPDPIPSPTPVAAGGTPPPPTFEQLKATRLAKSLASRKARTESFLFEGDEYLVVEPSVQKRADLYASAVVNMGKPNQRIDMARLNILATIECVQVPGPDGEPAGRLYDSTHFDTLQGQPGSSSIVSVAAPLAMKLMGAKEAEEAAKND